MELLFIILFLVIIYLISILLRNNPFDRILCHREYSIQTSLTNRYRCDREISFTKYANTDSLRTSIFDATYQIYKSVPSFHYPSISFENFNRWNLINNAFFPLHFSTISFFNIDPDQFNCTDFLDLPCDRLVLPHNMPKVSLYTNSIPHITELVIDSDRFVPLSPYSPTMYSDPINSSKPLDISVPDHLLSKYREDSAWSSIRFVDSDLNVSSITFNGLPPICKSHPSSESIYYMEASNGMIVRVPESKLDSWENEQAKQKEPTPHLTEAEKNLRDRIVRDIYGGKSS